MRQGAAVFASLLLGCVPELDVRNSVVDSPRILVVVADPPEARPGATVQYQALAVSPSGLADSAALRWAHCTTPRPLIGNGSVSDECLSEPGVPLSMQQGLSATGALPLDACGRFGPDPPPGNARPRDADSTGGFYQPLRIDAFGGAWLHFQRLLCNPRNAPADIARAFAQAYTPNQNPNIERLEAFTQGAAVVDEVPAAAVVELTLRWPSDAAEAYVWIDPGTAELVARSEELVVSWFATSGSFESDRTAASPGELASGNRWTAPRSAGPAELWAVLRDDRGGAAFIGWSVAVR